MSFIFINLSTTIPNWSSVISRNHNSHILVGFQSSVWLGIGHEILSRISIVNLNSISVFCEIEAADDFTGDDGVVAPEQHQIDFSMRLFF